MERIVIINQDSGYLTVDITNSLARRNHDVFLLAGRVVVRNNHLIDTVQVRKIIKYNRKSKFHRIFSWSIAFLQILFHVKTRFRKDYLIIVTNPPFATFLPLVSKNRYSLLVFDVYPDVMSQMRVLSEKSIIYKFWVRVNRKVFARAEEIFTLSERMSTSLKNYCFNKEITIMPLWGDSGYFKKYPKEKNPFVLKNRIKDKFVVMYSGNLGATHNVKVFTELAQRVKNSKIIFMIIGEGDRKKWLEEEIRKKNLRNCMLLPLQPVEKIPYSFSAADIAVVSLSTNASGSSVPSKTFSFMSAGLPLLCIAGEDSELNKLVSKYNNGVCLSPENLDKITDFIENIALDTERLRLYQTNSLGASKDFTVRNAEIIGDKILIKFKNTK